MVKEHGLIIKNPVRVRIQGNKIRQKWLKSPIKMYKLLDQHQEANLQACRCHLK